MVAFSLGPYLLLAPASVSVMFSTFLNPGLITLVLLLSQIVTVKGIIQLTLRMRIIIILYLASQLAIFGGRHAQLWSTYFIFFITQGECSDGDVRLVDSPEGRDYEGRLEICYGGKWGTVCNYHYRSNDNTAKVVCAQLGLSLDGEWKFISQ